MHAAVLSIEWSSCMDLDGKGHAEHKNVIGYEWQAASSPCSKDLLKAWPYLLQQQASGSAEKVI